MNYKSNAVMAALASETRVTQHVRHKCFISYHHADDEEVAAFIDQFSDVFIARVVGVSDSDDDLINSNDSDYVMRRIRELYLTDSTVTIVMVGKCTWARRYVDWEIASTLRNDYSNKRSGLMGVTLPSAASLSGRQTPPRLDANVLGADGLAGFARWWKYPTSRATLRSHIEDAFNARQDSNRVSTIDNTAALFVNSRQCS